MEVDALLEPTTSTYIVLTFKNEFLVFQDKIETRKTIEKMNETNNWFFKKITKID